MSVFCPQTVNLTDVTGSSEGIDFVLAKIFHQLRELIVGEQGLQFNRLFVGVASDDFIKGAANIFTTIPLIQVAMRPMTTIWKGLMAKAVRQMIAPATLTDLPMSKCRYLLTILAKMSRPPVEALIENISVCAALRIITQQSRSNQGLPITEKAWSGATPILTR